MKTSDTHGTAREVPVRVRLANQRKKVSDETVRLVCRGGFVSGRRCVACRGETARAANRVADDQREAR